MEDVCLASIAQPYLYRYEHPSVQPWSLIVQPLKQGANTLTFTATLPSSGSVLVVGPKVALTSVIVS